MNGGVQHTLINTPTRYWTYLMSIDVDYENPWIYNGVPFDGSLLGIIMVLFITLPISQTNLYIKKVFGFRHQKERRKVKSESDWRKYYGSCPELKEDIERLGRQNFSRTILSLHKTPGKTNFEETTTFINGVLTESLEGRTSILQ